METVKIDTGIENGKLGKHLLNSIRNVFAPDYNFELIGSVIIVDTTKKDSNEIEKAVKLFIYGFKSAMFIYD